MLHSRTNLNVVYSMFTLQNFAVEVLVTDHDQLEKSSIVEEVRKAGGANYGTGVRD